MKCPLLTSALSDLAALSVKSYPDCLEGLCAWWNLEGNECIVHPLSSIAGILRYWGKSLLDEAHTANQRKGYLRD